MRACILRRDTSRAVNRPLPGTDTVKAAVASLQGRLQFGAIFVSDRYGEIAGTLPMSLIKTESSEEGRAPDIIVSFSYDENAAVAGVAGISYASSVNRRGDHGSFSPADTLISLMASGPDFKEFLQRYAPHRECGHRAYGCADPRVRNACCAGTHNRGSSPGRTAPQRVRGSEQDTPVVDEHRIDREAAHRLTSFTKERYLPASAGMVKGTRQTSCAYSPMARSEENHAMLAIFMMHIRVQSDGDRHSPSMRRCVAK